MPQEIKTILAWLPHNKDLSTTSKREIYDRYMKSHPDSQLTHHIFGRLLHSQSIRDKSIRIDDKTEKCYDIRLNSKLVYIPQPQKQFCSHCNGIGYRITVV